MCVCVLCKKESPVNRGRVIRSQYDIVVFGGHAFDTRHVTPAQ